MVDPRRLALAALLASGLACAADAPPARDGAYDPWEGFNRKVFAFNLKVDRAVLRPLARGYRDVVPAPARTGVSNFLDNLEQPLSSVNQLLQGKPVRAGGDLSRFVINLTLGLGGFLDPASTLGLQQGDEDFGQTLGKWGVGEGPYLVLPFMPGRSLRDWGGEVADVRGEPSYYVSDDWTYVGLQALDLLEQRYRLLDLDEALDQAYDPYTFVRDAFLQRREYKTRDGVMPPVDYDDLYEDPGEPEEPAAPPPADEPPPR